MVSIFPCRSIYTVLYEFAIKMEILVYYLKLEYQSNYFFAWASKQFLSFWKCEKSWEIVISCWTDQWCHTGSIDHDISFTYPLPFSLSIQDWARPGWRCGARQPSLRCARAGHLQGQVSQVRHRGRYHHPPYRRPHQARGRGTVRTPRTSRNDVKLRGELRH